jgi:hypothetical protein
VMGGPARDQSVASESGHGYEKSGVRGNIQKWT